MLLYSYAIAWIVNIITFIQASLLTLFNDTDNDADQEDDLKRPVAVVAPYDEVAEDECKKPTRKAPPVPGIIMLVVHSWSLKIN